MVLILLTLKVYLIEKVFTYPMQSYVTISYKNNVDFNQREV